MKTALYARVSTSDQTAEMQLRELREHAARRGWQVVGEYVDTGISGTKASRPELDRLMADVKSGLFEVVAVWKFDRMARSVTHLLHVLEVLKTHNVEFASLTEAIDTSSAMGKCMMTVMGAFAELERSTIIERVKTGMRNAKAKGKHVGRKAKTVDAAQLHALRAEGKTVRDIASTMNLSIGLVHKALQKAA
jgi:DNA invertase Pin-like site-specific DNA recombinase